MSIGGNENQPVRNHVVVLGGGSSLKTKRQMENNSGNNKPKPVYDHCMIYMYHMYFVIEDGFEIYHRHYYLFLLSR